MQTSRHILYVNEVSSILFPNYSDNKQVKPSKDASDG